MQQLAEAQALSMLGAVHAGFRHPVGDQIRAAFRGEGWADRAARAAAASMALDYDETVFAGHIGHSTVLVPVACAAARDLDGRAALLAQVAAGEVAARITASVTLGRARGQAAAYTHLAGAAIAGGLALGLPVGQIVDATALALSSPPRTLYPAFMGSGAKLSVAAGPILLAARCLDAAAAGIHGLASIMESGGGLLESLAVVPLPEAMGAYGERWHLRTLSLKRFPGCAYLSAAVDAAIDLSARVDAADIDDIEVGSSILTIRMEAESAPFLDGPRSPLPALNFSLGYSIATAITAGGLEAEDFAPPRLDEAARWRLAEKVRPVHDPALTLRALTATAPLGAALAWAGPRARDYLQASGAGEAQVEAVLTAASARAADHFARPTKEVGANLVVRLRDGSTLEAARAAAAGSCSEPVADRLALARAKFERESGRAPLSLGAAGSEDLRAAWAAAAG